MTADRRRYQLALRRQRDQRIQDRPLVRERITMALDWCNLYGPEVDHALGVEEPTVDEWESGAQTPTPEQVRAIARLTDHPIAWFYTPITPIGPIFICSDEGCETYDPRPTAPVIPIGTQRERT